MVLLVAGSGGCTPPPDPASTPEEPRGLPSPVRTASAPGSGPLGLKWSWFQPATFDFVEHASGGWTFHEVEWCDIEPTPGERRWREIDGIVDRALALGHQPLLKLRTGQCWGTLPPVLGGLDPTEAVGKTTSTPPADVAAYLAFVSDVVQRYAARGVHDWAVENEVDVANHWASDLPSYDALVRQVVPVIRAVDPEARVLDAGLSSTSYGVAMATSLLASGDEAGALRVYRDHYARRIEGAASRWPDVATVDELRAVLAGAPALRSVEALDLAAGLATDGVVDAFQLHYYESAAALPELLRMLRTRLGDTVPIEAWEVGVAWPGGDYTEQAHASEVMRLVAALLAHDIRRIVYLPVAFTPGHRTQVFRGLTHEDGELLVAGHTWLALVDAVDGMADTAPTPIEGDLTGVAWTADGGDAAILWAVGDPAALPGDVELRVLDAAGLEVDRDLPVGTEPVLVIGAPGEDLVGGLTDGG